METEATQRQRTTGQAPRGLTRRSFLAGGLAALAAPGAAACGGFGPSSIERDPGDPRLTARPSSPTTLPQTGESALGLNGLRDGLLFVPEAYTGQRRWPLLVMLHGAGGGAEGLRGFGGAADSRGMVVLIPESRGATWDRVRGSFGADVAFLDRALEHAFARCNIDPDRIALGGFSDGASYALSLGVSNGDLFSHLIAFSPGFMSPAEPLVGKPLVFVSHGTLDTVLGVALSRDRIVPSLKGDGYSVRYEQFIGGHTITPEIAGAALDWFLDGAPG